MEALRVLMTTQVTLTRTFTVDETPTNVSVGPAVTVTRWDGTVVSTGNATPTGPPGVYAFTLTGGITNAAATWQLDHLTVTWEATVGGSVVRLSQGVEVVGGFYLNITNFRSEFRDYRDASKYTGASLAAKRTTVERELERITWRAFVPRFAVDHTWGSGTRFLGLRECEPRLIRSVTAAGTAWSPAQVATVGLMANGIVTLPEGGIWPNGSDITIEYEHGLDVVPGPVEEAAMYRLKSRLARPGTAVPDNASSYTTQEGAIYRLGRGDRNNTGVPTVDSDLIKFARKRRSVFA